MVKDNKKVKEEELEEKLENEEDEELERGTEDEELEKEEEAAEEEVVDDLEAAAHQVKGLEEQLKRAVADYRNLENRIREEKLDFVRYANKNLIEQLLPAFDTLLLAEKYSEDQNIKITVKHILEVLKNAGVEKVPTVGHKYEPSTMEAIEVVQGAKDEVIEETQPGFTLNGKVIRPARVKVGGKEIEN